MSNQNKALVRRAIEEVWDQGQFDVIEELYASAFVGHQAGADIAGQQWDIAAGAHAYIRQYFSLLHEAFPDIHFDIEDQIAEGDRVVTRWTARATHLGPYQGMPATGKAGVVTGVTIYRVADSKIVEGWTNLDELGMLQQLRLLPAPGQTGMQAEV
jgi:steroid delta-isomerase-like uncharacterized protein